MAEKTPRQPFIVEAEGAPGGTNVWFVGYMGFYAELFENLESNDKFIEKAKNKEFKEMLTKSWSSQKPFIEEELKKSLKGYYEVVVVQNLKEISLLARARQEAEVPYYIPVNVSTEIAAQIRAFAFEHGIKEAPSSFIEAAAKNIFYNGIPL